MLLTETEAGCLLALRSNPGPKTRIAIAAGYDLKTTLRLLAKLAQYDLAERDAGGMWRATPQGIDVRIEIGPDPARRDRRKPGPAARRLLEALDKPMLAAELAARLKVTHQRIRQLAISLHAHGLVRFGDQGAGMRLIARQDDPTVLLSKDESRLLSAVPDAYPTSMSKMRSAARLTTVRARGAVSRLLALGLIDEVAGPVDEELYGITETGLAHPQRLAVTKQAELPHLPVKSERVLAVLANISDRGETRIRDVAQTLGLPRASANALFQYLKRRSLVRKSAQGLNAPYVLTEDGQRVLAELTRRGAS